MKTKPYQRQKLNTALAASIFIALTLPAFNASADTTFNQVNLVTDDQSVNAAQITDPNLKNPWGIAFNATGPFWISDNATGVSTLYRTNPTTNVTSSVPLIVKIPGTGSVTGQVFNNSTAFNANSFLFVSEDGTISGWRGALGTNAETLVAGSAANVYKGVAETAIGPNNYLLAANFKAGSIDVIPGSNTAPALLGNFVDPNLAAGYAPFNIENLGGNLYVAYALQDAAKHDDDPGAGHGFIDEFNAEGQFITRIASQGALDSPWGMAIAPSSFGQFAGDLLVGNFGDGKINVYDAITHALIGQLMGGNGQPLTIDGLWSLKVGNNAGSGSNQALYFTAGPNGETNGLLGSISAVPAPSALWMFSSALVGIGLLRKRQES